MFIALRSFKYKDRFGNYVMSKAGTVIPEAEGWKKRNAYVERGWIAPVDQDGKARRPHSARLRGHFAKAIIVDEPLPTVPATPPPDGDANTSPLGDVDATKEPATAPVETGIGEIDASLVAELDAAAGIDDAAVAAVTEPLDEAAVAALEAAVEADAAIDEPDAVDQPAGPTDLEVKSAIDELSRMSKGELQRAAESIQIDPNQSKAKLLAALTTHVEAQAMRARGRDS